MQAAGIKVKFDKEIGFKEIPVLDQHGMQIGTKYFEVRWKCIR